MPSIINASTSGAGGVITTADASGVLQLQTAGTTAISVDASQNVTLTNVLPQASGGTGTTIGYNGFKNRIINGAMMIDQRNAGASVTVTGAYTLDRWLFEESCDAVTTVQQVSDAPAGFTKSLKVTATTADSSIGATQYSVISQWIEGNNIADFGFGTANATPVTIGVWVKASQVGTYSCTITNGGGSRINPQPLTINSANTWEYKSITFAGDTTGTWLSDNGRGLSFNIYLALGSTYLGSAGWNSVSIYGVTGQANAYATVNNTFQITGVQLEKGSTATSFDYRPYGTELALAQRYYTKSYNDGVAPATVTDIGAVSFTAQATAGYIPISPISLLVEMRTTPTVTIFNPVTGSSTASVCIRNINANTNHAGYAPLVGSRYINLSTDNSTITSGNRITAHFTASAEL